MNLLSFTSFTDLLHDVFLEPPSGVVAQHYMVALVGTIALVPGALLIGFIYTRRTRSPLFVASALAGAFLYPFAVEPLGDWFVATCYAANQPIAATILDRDIPWFVVLGYATGIPVATVAAWEIVKRGLPAKMLITFTAVVVLLEVPIELAGQHYGFMHYYGNHAVLGGIPIYCFVQNGGFLVVIAWTLAKVLPHVHGWRWVMVPFVVAAVLPVYALVATWPAYWAIAAGAGPAVGWTAGIISTVLNAAVVVACAYSPALAQFRETAAATTRVDRVDA